jgi:hypothetical protein
MATPKPRKRVTVQAIDDFLERTADLATIAQQYESQEAVTSTYRIIERIYDRLLEWRQARFTYATMAQMLLDLFDITIAASTLRDYMSRVRDKRAYQAQVKVSRRKPARAKPQSALQSVDRGPTSSDRALTSFTSTPVSPASESVGLPLALPPSLPPALPVIASEFTPEELETALKIPKPLDAAGIERFQRGLEQIKLTDPKRWRLLRSQALEQGVNLLGIIMPSIEKINAMFNQY